MYLRRQRYLRRPANISRTKTLEISTPRIVRSSCKMLYKVWGFIKRHKKKFIFTAAVLFGGRYLYHYVMRRLKEFQDQEAAECLEHARRQHHFDNNQRTCNMTVLSMLPTLRERLVSLLNTEEITEKLKSNPTDKVHLWEDLKVLSFTRVIVVVYACTMMCLMLRVQLNIIGGYMFLENMKQHKGKSANAAVSVSPTPVQERYLALIRQYFDKGVENLVNKVKEAVYKETTSLSLKEKFSLQNLEAIIKHVRERIENGREVSIKEIPTMPLCEYLITWKSPNQSAEDLPSDDLFLKLLQETEDILESNDFHVVFSTGLDRGFSKLVDYLAEFYQPLQKKETSIVQLHDVSMPLAKLIPCLSGLLYKLASDAPNPLVQELLLLEQTKTLAANIYEAFSQLEEEDPQLAP